MTLPHACLAVVLALMISGSPLPIAEMALTSMTQSVSASVNQVCGACQSLKSSVLFEFMSRERSEFGDKKFGTENRLIQILFRKSMTLPCLTQVFNFETLTSWQDSFRCYHIIGIPVIHPFTFVFHLVSNVVGADNFRIIHRERNLFPRFVQYFWVGGWSVWRFYRREKTDIRFLRILGSGFQ